MDHFEAHPIVMWELTRACDRHCTNCTIGATDRPDANELTTYEAYKTIDQFAALAPREFIMTGGDPLERGDVVQLVDYARRRGLDPALVASPTAQLTGEAIARLERGGLSRIVFSVDGAAADVHDAVRGVAGLFEGTMRAMRSARQAGLAIEVNTLITRANAGELSAIASLLRPIGIARWNLYFLVPLKTASLPGMLTESEGKGVFRILDAMRERERFAIRVVEAPHYRHHRLQRGLDATLVQAVQEPWPDFTGYELTPSDSREDLMACAVDGARGFVFISHAGDVRASEFLPFSAGNLRYRPLGAIYRASDLFVALRDPENLTGRCGRCEFRHLCGGSRARAWAVAGNVFADDPLCAWEPGTPLPLPIVSGPAQQEISS